MSVAADLRSEGAAEATAARPRWVVVSAVGTAQILAWDSSYYLPAVLAGPIAADTGWPLAWIFGALSVGLLVSGLVSPRVGHLIERRSGRPVLTTSAVLLSLGLLGLGLSPALPVFVACWVVIGVGMGAGLYDPAFSALGRLYGEEARSAITQVTLFSGLASTFCWPLSAFLAELTPTDRAGTLAANGGLRSMLDTSNAKECALVQSPSPFRGGPRRAATTLRIRMTKRAAPPIAAASRMGMASRASLGS